MSFTYPKNVPSFDDDQRNYENVYWSRFQKGTGLSNAAGGLFESQTLPLYKDKPYQPSRKRPFWLRKRVFVGASLGLLLLLWILLSRQRTNEDRVWTSWGTFKKPASSGAGWTKKMDAVKAAFELSWDGYERYAWGEDEYYAEARNGKSVAPGGLGYVIVDSLDTLMLMNSSRLPRAREWVAESLSFSKDVEVHSFNATSQVLGGLLSAHYLSTEIPELTAILEDDSGETGEDLYIEKATDLADRLFGAFDSPSKIPYPKIHLDTRIGSVLEKGMSTTMIGHASSMQLEFRYIASLLGEKLFWDAADYNAQNLNAQADSQALVSGLVNVVTGASETSRGELSALTIPYYESLLKQYLQTSRQEPTYWNLWVEALSTIRHSFVALSRSLHLIVLGEAIADESVVAMEEATCRIPGLIALGATGGHTLVEAKKSKSWSPKKDDDITFAKGLMKTCWALYKASPSGLAATRSLIEVISNPPPEKSGMYPPGQDDWKTISKSNVEWKADISLSQEQAHNDQDSSFVESLFYLWRITGNEMYREMGWELFSSYINHTSTVHKDGFVSLSSVLDPSKQKDHMNSLWLSRTLKFFYLLFAPVDLLPLEKVVFTTSGHVFPRFKVPRNFRTASWKQSDKGRTGTVTGPTEESGEMQS